MLDSIKEELIVLGIASALAFGATKGCNMAFNNRNIKTAGRHTISHTTGLVGHIEYTKYKDDSADVKIYPSFWGHRYASSKLYQDLNGDGLVDRIRINGPEWQMNRLVNIFIRDTDYKNNMSLFNKADRILAEETAKYENRK